MPSAWERAEWERDRVGVSHKRIVDEGGFMVVVCRHCSNNAVPVALGDDFVYCPECAGRIIVDWLP